MKGKKTAYQIKLSNPCPESWDEMIPSETGRYCSSCSRNVIDCTGMSDEELIAFFQENNGQFCGHFNKQQLNRPLLPATFSKEYGKSPVYYGALAGLLLLASPDIAFSMTDHQVTEAIITLEKKQKTKSAPDNIQESIPADTTKTFSGKVIRSKTGRSLPYTDILLEGTSIRTTSGNDGTFALEIPEKFLKKGKLVFVFSHVSYKSRKIRIHPRRLPKIETIKLKFDPAESIQPIITTGYPTMELGSIEKIEKQ